MLVLKGARGNNLKNVTLELPLGLITCITGVSGSGKSTLINDTLAKITARELNRAQEEPAPYDDIRGLEHLDKVINVDQSPSAAPRAPTPPPTPACLPPSANSSPAYPSRANAATTSADSPSTSKAAAAKPAKATA
ncbi:excinuclease ABC subunit A [Neisseria gonorrhoeae]|uniref:UvrABC system protein A n=1 Tax=Neisseria gonorrhoeae TaxID=485 RepID=A0A378VWL5_NEIGO|nr:excinuclease ABC subunit A [Neisseria gonorrhoeae]